MYIDSDTSDSVSHKLLGIIVEIQKTLTGWLSF